MLFMNLLRNYSLFHIILNFILINSALNSNTKLYLILLLLLNIIYFVICGYFYLKKYLYIKKLKKIIYDESTLLYSELSLPNPFDSDTQLISETTLYANQNYRKVIQNLKNNDLEYKEFIELWIHEIKTPLSAIYLLNKNDKIENELNRIDNHLNFALYYAKSNDVNQDYFVRSISLKSSINHVIKKHKNIFLSKKIIPILFEDDILIHTDQKWFEFILFQIVDNALKYSNSNSKIEFSVQKLKHQIQLNITDYGIGIPKHDLPRIFEKGFSGSNRNIEKSSGLGLYLVHKICGQLNHSIKAESSNNKTTITLSFPFEETF